MRAIRQPQSLHGPDVKVLPGAGNSEWAYGHMVNGSVVSEAYSPAALDFSCFGRHQPDVHWGDIRIMEIMLLTAFLLGSCHPHVL